MPQRVSTLLALLALAVSCAPPGDATDDTDAVAERHRPATPSESPPVPAPRSPDEEEVLAAVQRFFDTMPARDVEGARSVLDPEGDFVSVRRDETGHRVVRRAPNADYLERLPALNETYLERLWNAEVRIHGPIATVWAPYDFYIDDQFSHCGVDAFQLLKTDDGWMITGGIYTVEQEGCPESPLGPLATAG